MNTRSFSVRSMAFLLTVTDNVDAGRELALGLAVELYVHDLNAEVELYAEALEVLYHRQDHGLILVVLCETERLEIRQTADVVDIALNIAFHLKSAVPVLKREHRAPVEPEVGVQHLVIEEIGYASCPGDPPQG